MLGLVTPLRAPGRAGSRPRRPGLASALRCSRSRALWCAVAGGRGCALCFAAERWRGGGAAAALPLCLAAARLHDLGRAQRSGGHPGRPRHDCFPSPPTSLAPLAPAGPGRVPRPQGDRCTPLYLLPPPRPAKRRGWGFCFGHGAALSACVCVNEHLKHPAKGHGGWGREGSGGIMGPPCVPWARTARRGAARETRQPAYLAPLAVPAFGNRQLNRPPDTHRRPPPRPTARNDIASGASRCLPGAPS
jgi:hypothetical protein